VELTDAMCVSFTTTANAFQGAGRRRYMAETVEAFGISQRQAERLLGWSRDTVRKALRELHSGITCVDNFTARGRKPTEFHLPRLFQDIRELVQEHLQTDPTFQSTRLYCRVSAASIREQLVQRKGYSEEQLPTVQTVGEKLNLLGFRLRSVTKSRPQKG
jgi:transposase